MKFALSFARQIAEALQTELAQYCDHIEIGGSIRRKKEEVGDIELVCIPKKVLVPTAQTALDGSRITLYSNPLFTRLKSYNVLKMGERYAKIQLDLTECDDWTEEVYGEEKYLKADIFTATPETWGYIFLLRTGPAEFSKFIVTELKKRGFTPKDGAIYAGGKSLTPLHTPTEADVFALLRADWIEPECRFEGVIWK